MASSSSEASTKVYKNGQGILWYAQGSVTELQVLESVTGKTDWNVHNFVFDYSLAFCQKHQDDRCTIKYLPGSYGEPKFDNKDITRLELVFQVTGTPECTFSGDKDKAKEFPLAKLYGSFTHVAIEFKWQDFKPSFQSLHRCRQELSHLTRGSVTQLPESNEAVFLKQMRDVSEAESKAQEALVGTQKGCHIRTLRWRKTIVIQVWPQANIDNADLQGMYFSIRRLDRVADTIRLGPWFGIDLREYIS